MVISLREGDETEPLWVDELEKFAVRQVQKPKQTKKRQLSEQQIIANMKKLAKKAAGS